MDEFIRVTEAIDNIGWADTPALGWVLGLGIPIILGLTIAEDNFIVAMLLAGLSGFTVFALITLPSWNEQREELAYEGFAIAEQEVEDKYDIEEAEIRNIDKPVSQVTDLADRQLDETVEIRVELDDGQTHTYQLAYESDEFSLEEFSEEEDAPAPEELER